MRMKVSTRIILTIYLVVVILLSAFLLAVTTGLIIPDHLAASVGTIIYGDIFYKIIYIVIFAAMIIFGFIIMFFGINKGSKKNILLSNTTSGNVSISIDAVQELAIKYVKSNHLVKNIKITTRCVKNMPVIDLKVSVPPQTDIPAVTGSLQTGLVEYIEKYTGSKVKNAAISVIQIDDSINTTLTGGNE